MKYTKFPSQKWLIKSCIPNIWNTKQFDASLTFNIDYFHIDEPDRRVRIPKKNNTRG